MNTLRALLVSVVALAALAPHQTGAQRPAPQYAIENHQPRVAAAAAVRPVVEQASLALVDGRWKPAETRVVQALIYVDGQAPFVQVRARRVVTVTLDGQQLDVLSAAAVSVVEVSTNAGRCYGLDAGAGKYQVEVLSIDPNTGISSETITVDIGANPNPNPTPDDPQPQPGQWAKVLSGPAKQANLTSEEASVMASAFRSAAAGSYSTVAELTGAASKQYTDQLGINRTTELLDFRQAIVAELRRLALTTVDQYKAEFGKLAAALEAIQ